MIEHIEGWAADGPVVILTSARDIGAELVPALLAAHARAVPRSSEAVRTLLVVTDRDDYWRARHDDVVFETLGRAHRATGVVLIDLPPAVLGAEALESRRTSLTTVFGELPVPVIAIVSPSDPLLSQYLEQAGVVFALPDALEGFPLATPQSTFDQANLRAYRWRREITKRERIIRALESSPFASQVLELVWDWHEAHHRVLRFGTNPGLALPIAPRTGPRTLN
jgi:hypothetical protein